jgi:outer membrane protein OmpA-like peptidoglycan-associated protein
LALGADHRPDGEQLAVTDASELLDTAEKRPQSVEADASNAAKKRHHTDSVERTGAVESHSAELARGAGLRAASIGIAPGEGTDGSHTLTFPADFALNAIEPSEVARRRVATFVRALGSCNGGIRITGHSCGLGTELARDAVSLGRARWVAAILEQAGLPRAAMQIQGVGNREPIADDRTLPGRIKNRRVTVSCTPPERNE